MPKARTTPAQRKKNIDRFIAEAAKVTADASLALNYACEAVPDSNEFFMAYLCVKKAEAELRFARDYIKRIGKPK
jgi:hypothetical protein